MIALPFIAPALALALSAFVLLAVDAFTREADEDASRIGFGLTLLLLIGSASFLRWPTTVAEPASAVPSMLLWDGLSYYLSWLGIITVFLVVLVGSRYKPFVGVRMSAYYALLLLSTAGLVLIASANDFLMIFIGIELVGIPALILVGYLHRDQRSAEGALKFFLVGAFSSALLAYGLSIFYGITGTTSLSALSSALPQLQLHSSLARLAIFFLLASFGFKSGLVPFHLWVPDAMEGAPTPISAFVSVAPKIAGLSLALRVFELSFPGAPAGLFHLLAVLAVLTMTVSNLFGLRQTNVVRLLAYSSIAQMGYMLIGLVVGTPTGVSSLYYYGAVYLFMNLGAFAVITCVYNATRTHELSGFEGLSQRAPRLCALLAFFLLSLAGLPPTAGFFAKFNLFTVAYQNGWLWLVVIAAVNTAVSTAYYLKILHAVYFKTTESQESVDIPPASRLALAVTTIFTIAMGLAPQFFLTKTDMLAGVPALSQPMTQPLVAGPADPLPTQVTIPPNAPATKEVQP